MWSFTWRHFPHRFVLRLLSITRTIALKDEPDWHDATLRIVAGKRHFVLSYIWDPLSEKALYCGMYTSTERQEVVLNDLFDKVVIYFLTGQRKVVITLHAVANGHADSGAEEEIWKRFEIDLEDGEEIGLAAEDESDITLYWQTY